MLSGFLKAQPRRLYASLASPQVLQHLQKHKHHLTISIARKRGSSSGLESLVDSLLLQQSNKANIRDRTLKGGLMLLKELELLEVLLEILA